MQVVEFNARFGDPETQVVLALLGAARRTAASGGVRRWPRPALQWLHGSAVTVVIAAHGYPENPVKGDKIKFDKLHLNGPAVISSTQAPPGPGPTESPRGAACSTRSDRGPIWATARAAAYEVAEASQMRGGWYLHDIAERAARA